MTRWLVYQKERFPVLAHGPLIAAFSASAVSFAHLLRTDDGLPIGASFAVAFVTCLVLFFQLRVADEFKDAEEDARYRPDRPVPRGLVTLRELGWAAAAGGVLQLALTWWLEPRLIVVLAGVWLYLGLMSREFFVRRWIVARPITYMWTHMLILPLIDFYATACDWLPGGGTQPHGLFWFLAVSFCNGIVIELGRKIRAPEDEQEGVRTYSSLYGARRAVGGWLGALAVTALCAWRAAAQIGWDGPMAVILACLLVPCALVGTAFLRAPAAARAKGLETASGIWTLAMYLGLGVVPLFVRYLA